MKAESKTKTVVAEVPEEEVQKKGKVEKKAGKRIGFNYIIVKSLKESKKNDVVKCLFIKKFWDFGFCVIKEGTEGDTKDKAGRDIQDRLKWQKELHEQLQGKVDLPKYYGSFEENGNYYLVIELIRGRSLGSMIKRAGRKLREELISEGKNGNRFLGYLIQIIDQLIALHKEGIVHRDASSGNFVINRWGKVRVIDMELSYSVKKHFPTPAFELGTFGYMSPQQELMQTPTLSEDIFAVGAIVLQVWTGISPSKLTRPGADELADRIRFFIPDERLSEIVIKCLDPVVENRGSLAELREVLVAYRKDLQLKKERAKNRVEKLSVDQLTGAVEAGISTLCSPLMADPERGWFAQNQATVIEDRSKIDKEYYGSFQFGVSGVLYFFSKVAKVGLNSNAAIPHIASGLKVIESKYITRAVSGSPGLYYGASGVAAALYSAKQDQLINGDGVKNWINTLLQRTNDESSFLNGRPGQSISLIHCLPELDTWNAEERIRENFQFLVDLQKPDGSWITFKAGKKGKEKISSGMVYGMAGSVWFLLEYYKKFKDATALAKAEAGLFYMIKKKSGLRHGIIEWRSSSKHKLDYGWCTGFGGIVLTLLKAWELTGNPIYKAYAEGTLKSLEEKIVDTDFSQCHGLSGLGELYLEAFRLFKDELWLKRAGWIVQVLLNTRSLNSKYGHFWVVGQEKHPIAGFMIGNSGILHFLLRFLYPDKIAFPLLSSANYSGRIQLESASSSSLQLQ